MKQITVKEITDTVTVCAKAGKHIKITDRPYCGLSFCREGKITYTHNGKKYVSAPDNAVFLPQGATYELYNNSKGEFPLINFTCTEHIFDGFTVIPLNGNRDELLDSFDKMRDSTQPYGKMSLFYSILDILLGKGEKSRILRFIEKNYSDSSMDNEMLAREVGMSEGYFRKVFKERYGTTPKRYVLSVRIRQAERKLAETNLSITEISELCGFASVYNFSRIFKKIKKVSPAEYRKMTSEKGI